MNPFSQFVQKLQNEYNLTEAEAKAVDHYRGPGSKQLNNKILQNNLSNDTIEHIKSLKSAMVKLPKVEQTFVYRNFDFLDSQTERALDFFSDNTGKTISLRIFSSTTKLENLTGNEDDYGLTIRIETNAKSEGADFGQILEKLNINNTEEEVVFDTDCCFEVIEVDPSSRIKVTLKEVSRIDNPKVIPVF